MDEVAELMRSLTVERVLDAALEAAPAKAFKDTSFVPNLERCMVSARRTGLSATGLRAQYAGAVRMLTNRLRWEAGVERNREILDEDVSDPIIILGLPRSGTTKMQRFLSSDPNVQATPIWRMLNPAPFPGEVPGDPSPRIAWSNKMLRQAIHTPESYQVMHDFNTHEPDESSLLLGYNFDSVMHFITTPDKEHLDWTRSISRVPAITFVKRMLQYLQWQDGGRRGRPWVLKNPGDTGQPAELLEVFPNATFVISQRDLATTMGSSFRMMGEILSQSFDHPDPIRYAAETVEYWSHELNRYQEQRRQLGDRIRIVEAEYNRSVSDGVTIAKEVYRLHGFAWTKEGEAAMRQWELDNPRHKLGSYGYRLEDYGWTAEKVEDAFGPIAQRWKGY